MSQCPKCHGEITIQSSQFGSLYTCPHCSAVFFVGWDGQPEIASENPNPQASAYDAGNEAPASPAYDAHADTPIASAFEPISDSVAEAPAPFAFQEMPAQEDYEQSVTPSFLSVDSSEPAPAPIAVAPVADESSVEEPLVLYDLTIDGLDLKSIWEPVQDVLREPRLKFDVAALEKNIKDGTLLLPRLSPLVVFYIVQRIKSFNVGIHWKVNET